MLATTYPMLELYQRVSLNRDFLGYNLKKGDIATLVDTVPHPTGGEDGYVKKSVLL